jgi:hypothetical protein
MKPSRVLPFTFLLAATVFGQDLIKILPPAAPNPGVTYNAPVVEKPGSNCPVDMAVDRSGLYEKREVRSAPYPGPTHELEQRIQLDLTNRHPTTIVEAQITIHGLSQKTRYMELSTPQADMAKTFQLSLDLKGNGQSAKVLWLTRFAVITSVDLNSVTYSDGSFWHEPAAAACSVAPNLLVRVTDAAR